MNSTLSIKRAIIENIDSIMDIVSKCTQHMISNGIFQWNDTYPSRETFLKDIEDENLYVLFKARLIIDGIFGDNLLTETIQKSNNEQGFTSEKPEPLVEDTATVEALLKLKEKHQPFT